MKTLYIDASHGVSGDMVLNGLLKLTDAPEAIRMWLEEAEEKIVNYGNDAAGEDHHGHFHRSYREVLDIIKYLDIDREIQDRAKAIYAVIAEAEAKVHGSSMDELHFHEVGRNQAVLNVVGVALCISEISPDIILCSEIIDGKGTVKCAHGLLEVPVPAVEAMLEITDLKYRQSGDYDGEMVTPSGLAMLIGIGAVTSEMPDMEPYRRSEATGFRSRDGQGLKACLFEE